MIDSAPDTRHSLLIAAAAFVLTLVAGMIGLETLKLAGRLAYVLLPTGVAVSTAYRGGWRAVPGVFAAGLGLDLFAGHRVSSAVLVGSGLALSALLTVGLLNRHRFNPNFSRSRDVAVFWLIAAVGMIPVVVLGQLGHFLTAVPAPTRGGLPMRMVGSWCNATAALLLVGPVFLTASRQTLRRFMDEWLTAGLWSLGVALFCGLIFWTAHPIARPLIVVAADLWIVLGAFRLGLTLTAAGTVALSLAATFSFLFNKGLFADMGDLPGLVTLWSFSFSMTGVSMVITALSSERHAASLEKLSAEHRYAEIFDHSPHPLWVHHRDSGHFLLVNEAAVARYGWSRDEFLTKRIEDLTAPGPWRVIAEAGDDGATEPLETRHRTRDGGVFDVEVWTRPIVLSGHPAVLVFAADVTERRAFGRVLIEAVAREQRRIGQEMHDGLGQELTGLALTARALATRAKREWPSKSAELAEISMLAAGCIQGARRIVQGLSPLTDADGSLHAALSGLARRSSFGGTEVSFRSAEEPAMSITLEARNHLYRIAQEAVQNAQKHAGATTITIDLSCRHGKIKLSVVDNGRGDRSEVVEGSRGLGLGMRTMRFRASAIGGRLGCGAVRDGGFSVVCELNQDADRRETA